MGSACSVVALSWAVLMQPAAWARAQDYGWGIAALVLAALAVTLQFFVGAVLTPDARVQLAAAEKMRRAQQALVDRLSAYHLPSVGRAVSGVVVLAVVAVVVVPLVFGAVAGVTTNSASEGRSIGAVTVSLAMMSAYAIAVGQFASGIA